MSSDLVFVHGWATDSGAWEGIAKEFAGSISIDLPGHGGQLGWDESTLKPAIDEIAGRVKGAKKGLIGVGWSLGSQALIAARPLLKERLRALVLVGSTPCFVEREDFHWAQSKALVKRMIMDMRKDPAATVDSFYSLNFTSNEAATDEAKAFVSRYKYPGPISCEGDLPGCFPKFRYGEITKALEALYTIDLREDIKTIDVPVLLVHGRGDSICPVGAAEYMASRMKRARLEAFDGAGHAPFLTRRDAFISVLKDFMKRLDDAQDRL
ncbi:MAG TPA: alpha/beta fold hydrolase [Thermodesulfobacteriota bacterium]